MENVPGSSADICNAQARTFSSDFGMERVAAEPRDNPVVVIQA